MTTRNIPVPLADLDALLAIRGVIADAAHHPGRAAAIEALDRLKAAWEAQSCTCGDAKCKSCCKRAIDELGAAGVRADGRQVVGRAVVKLESSGSVTTVVSRGIGDGPVPQRQCNHATFDAKCLPAILGKDALAQIAALFGYRHLEVARDEAESCWRILAAKSGEIGELCTAAVTDRDLVQSPLPTTPWFDAFAKLAAQLEVPDHASKLPALAEILACAMIPGPAATPAVIDRMPKPPEAIAVCNSCTAPLMYSARARGDGLCGPCSRRASGTSATAGDLMRDAQGSLFEALDKHGRWWRYLTSSEGKANSVDPAAPRIGECTPNRRWPLTEAADPLSVRLAKREIDRANRQPIATPEADRTSGASAGHAKLASFVCVPCGVQQWIAAADRIKPLCAGCKQLMTAAQSSGWQPLATPHPFRARPAGVDLPPGPAEETCADCQCDPRNTVHSHAAIAKRVDEVLHHVPWSAIANAVGVTLTWERENFDPRWPGVVTIRVIDASHLDARCCLRDADVIADRDRSIVAAVNSCLRQLGLKRELLGITSAAGQVGISTLER